MKKLLTWVVGGAFLLSLPALGLAQKEEKAAPPAPAPAVESQAPKEWSAPTEKTQKKETATKKSKKAKSKAKKTKKAKKPEQPAS